MTTTERRNMKLIGIGSTSRQDNVGAAAGLAAIDAATLAYTISQRLTTLHELPTQARHAHARETLTMCRELATQAGLIATSLYANDYHQQMQAARADLAMWRDGEQ